MSANYGVVLSQFFRSHHVPDETATRSYVAAKLHEIHAALRRHRRWESAAVRTGLNALHDLSRAGPPMMCKTDWSASNMLVQGDLGWPGPAQFAAHLERLTALAQT